MSRLETAGIPSESRKLAAIMFTDMVGYSALTQENESLALELLEEHRKLVRPIFSDYGGREVETVGDAFFVEFASALDAARCAVQIQRVLFQRNAALEPERHIRLRIGLHLGDVVHRDKHVHGDGVNIAARIEPLARPLGVCLSEDVARQIRNKIDLPLFKLGKGELKNIQLPVDIYRVVMPWEKRQLPLTDRVSFILRSRRIRTAVVPAALLLGALAYYMLSPSTSIPTGRRSIAVLPFRNLSEEAGSEYFSDGITEDIITHISKIRDLKVISRTSVMQYKNSDKSVRDIGNELSVATILEGSVRRANNQVRIVAQLIDAQSDDHMWSETYDTEMTQIFAIQSDVARRIATALESKLSVNEKAQLEKKATENLEAYDLYLKGRYYWNKRLPDKLQKGIEHFRQAIDKDPEYALAYAGLADSYTILGNLNLLPPRETYPEAKAAATKALSLDNALAEAHTALAFATMNYDWDWESAEREFQRAIEINPNYATAHGWYAFLLTIMGRFDEAVVARKKALDLDPLSPVINADVALTSYYEGRFDEAIRQFQKTLEIDPTFVVANIPLGGAYGQKKMYKEAIASFQKVTMGLSMASIRHPIPIAALGHVYAISGRKDEALDMLEILDDMSKTQYVAPYWMGVLQAGLGDNDRAIGLLEKAYAERDGSMVYLKVDPVFHGLRSDSRFVALLKRMGLDR